MLLLIRKWYVGQCGFTEDYIICRLDCNNGKGTADMMSSMMPSADKELSVRISYVNFRNN